jgi:alpha-glucosidase
VLYLRGGSILPVGLPIKHVGEASIEDNLSLLVALDENGMFL